MSDEQPQLQMLYFLRRVQLKQLRQTEHWIQEAERRAAQQVARRPPPPAPDWVLERGIGQGALPVLVHTGACYMQFTRRKALSRDEARRALADGVPACTHCHPDTDLGFLE